MSATLGRPRQARTAGLQAEVLYQRVLGDDFDALHPLLQRFHSQPDLCWHGLVNVVWSRQRWIRAALHVAGLPLEASSQALRVRVRTKGLAEQWQRQFSSQRLMSCQQLRDEQLQEHFGPWRLSLNTRMDGGALYQRTDGAFFVGLSLPAQLALSVQASEWVDGEKMHFDVRISLGDGLLLAYSGWLQEARA